MTVRWNTHDAVDIEPYPRGGNILKLIVFTAVMIVGVLYIDVVYNAILWLLPRRHRCGACKAKSLSYVRHTTRSPGHCPKCGADAVVTRRRNRFKLIDLTKG